MVGAACSSNETTTTAALESCFDTGGGHISCIATPNGADTTNHDVNGDGKPDTFVCVNGGKPDDEGKGDDKAENGDGGATKGDDDKDSARDGGKAEGDHARGSHDGGKAEGNDDKDSARDGGKAEGDHPRGPHDGGATKGGDAGKGAPRCEKMGCQDMRKKAGHGNDARGDHAGHDGGAKKGDDEGRGDDMMCPTAPAPTTPPVVPAP